jgi:hypothetical protein
MSYYYILDADNEVVPVETWDEYWAWLDRERAARGQGTPVATLQVARELIGDRPDCVSTVFLGLDHNWGGGPPLVFETMLFTDDERDQSLWRYSTWDEAVAGHAEVVSAVGSAVAPTDPES